LGQKQSVALSRNVPGFFVGSETTVRKMMIKLTIVLAIVVVVVVIVITMMTTAADILGTAHILWKVLM